MSLSSRFSMDRADSMQKLQLLASQEEISRRRLSLQVPSAPPTTTPSPEFHSISSSPNFSRSSSASWFPEPDFSTTTFTRPIPIESTMATHKDSIDTGYDGYKSAEINQQIKATLTEMLNTESVRADEKYRAWIQERLMDTEHQIRKQRRRHSNGDREVAESIAEHMSPRFSPRMNWR